MKNDNVIDFSTLKKGKKNAAQRKAPETEDDVSALLSALPEHIQATLGERFTYLMMFAMISGRVAELLKQDGRNPDLFEPERESMDFFLQNGPFYSTGKKEPLWNGPLYDCAEDGVCYRAASTIEMDGEEGFNLTVNLLKRQANGDQWMVYADGEWEPGPSDDYFDYLSVLREDWEDGLDFEPPELVEELDLNPSVLNVLDAAGIVSVAELCEKTAGELLALKGIGKKSLEAIRDELACWDLTLKNE